MPRAIWNGAVIAEAATDAVEVVEGNVYFPPDAVRADYLKPSDHTSVCPWKGTASYFNLEVAGSVNRDAAWTYRNPSAAAGQIANRIAFWRGVTVEP